MHYLVDLTLLMHCRLSCISWYVWLTLQPLPRIPCWRHWRCIILYDFLWLLRHWSGSKTFHQGSVPLAFEVLQSFISWVGILPKCTNNISQQREKNSMQFFVKTQRLLLSVLSRSTSNGFFEWQSLCKCVGVGVCVTKGGMTNPIKTNTTKICLSLPL